MQKYKRKSRNHVVIFLQNILFCFTPKKKQTKQIHLWMFFVLSHDKFLQFQPDRHYHEHEILLMIWTKTV